MRPGPGLAKGGSVVVVVVGAELVVVDAPVVCRAP